jgi:hypothetical protein
MNHILRVLQTISLLGMLAASLGPANAAQLQASSNAPYLCAAVNAAETANGTPVLAYDCSGAFDDQWNYVPSGEFQGLGTVKGRSTCLTETSAAPGGLVQLWTCTGNPNQLWYIYNGNIISEDTGYCLDSTTGKVPLVVNPCITGTQSQTWIVR